MQLSIDYNKPPQYHYNSAKQLKALRKKGVLIIVNGNRTRNLRKVLWDKANVPEYGYDWAIEMNSVFKEKIGNNDFQSLIEYKKIKCGNTIIESISRSLFSPTLY